MHNSFRHLIRYLVAFSLTCFLMQATLITGSSNTMPEVEHETRIGAILDETSRSGKEAKVAIELAIQDLNIKTSTRWVLYLQNSRNKPVYAAIAAKELIDLHNVKAILGAHNWEEASTIAEVISDNQSNHEIPLFLSLTSSIPQQATDQWPFFIQTVPTQTTHAITAFLQSLDIRQVTLIHETSLSANIMSHLYQTFQKADFELTHIVPITSGSCSLDEELESLKKQKLKVFVIHTSLELAVRLFQTAKKMEMIEDGYLWITTNEITDLFHSIDSTMISSLKGIVGVKSYFSENTKEFLSFRKRFRRKFRFDYPEEEKDEPGIFAVQGYNTMKLLEKHLPESFHKWKPISANVVEIVNVIGKGYNSVYWIEGLGFSETVEEDDINGATTNYTNSIDNVGQALWQLQPWYANKRRRNQEQTSNKRMKVGVPCKSLYPEFVECDRKHPEKRPTGFVISVFDEMMQRMSLDNYDLDRFDIDDYDLLMKKIRLGEYDAIAGDLTITEKRLGNATFTQPYTESGMVMIVPVKSRSSNRALLFLKPFTPQMLWLIGIITIYSGFVIWLIERSHVESLEGSLFTQIGIILWLSFTSLFTLRVDKMHSTLSRMAVVVWLFVAVVIIQSYTASLASMLTVERLEPTITSVNMLRNKNASVGYCKGSFLRDYLRDVLRFNDIIIKNYSSTDQYAEAFYKREIEAIFLEVPAAKVFLAQYCKSFIQTNETFKVGGYGFAFGKDFTRFPDANKALLNVSESGKLKQLEEQYLQYGRCKDEDFSPDGNESLSLHSFWVLFVMTGGTSTVSLTIYIIMSINKYRKSLPEHTNVSIQMAFMKVWQRPRQSSDIVSHV